MIYWYEKRPGVWVGNIILDVPKNDDEKENKPEEESYCVVM